MSDVYVVVHIATTCDDNNTYVSRDFNEAIEFSWSCVDAGTLKVDHTENIHIKPVNTPITANCSQVTKITWDDVKDAGNFKDAINQFDKYVQTHLLNENKDFSFVTMDISKLRVQLPREARDKGVVLPSYLQHPRIFDLQNEYCKWQTTHPEALSYTSNSLMNIITALEVDINRSCLTSPLSEMNSNVTTSMSPQVVPTISGSGSEPESKSESGPASKPESEATPNANANPESASKSNDSDSDRLLVNVYSKLLIQLIKKSLPLEDHSTVLTKPHDSSQDVKLFLTERSKILYLSNLPFDTTQSELESWFTQLGARPIAFWTLKNLETNNQGGSNTGNNTNNGNGNNFNNSNYSKNKLKGISGFAVFGTHEEATESLSMNGRALNDRLIEIQPSSTRVLDKASDLLTPFPPSKNRPRPGDWTCPSCGFSNFQRRTACFRCSFPATSAVAFQEQIHPNNMNMNRRNNNVNGAGGVNFNNNSPNNSVERLSLNGTGGANTSMNNMNYSSHGYSNYGGQIYGDNGQAMGMGMNNGGGNGGGNHHSGGGRNYGGNGGNLVPFRAGDWKCTNEACQYHNFAKNLVCLKCGIKKPINLHNSNQMNHKVNQMNSVSSTAAAIAAATASGHPLNLSSSYMGQSQVQQQGQSRAQQQQQSQQHHQQQQQQQQQLQQPTGLNSQQANAQTHYNTANLYPNDLSRTNSNGTPIQNTLTNINIPNSQLLTQQYLMMQPAPLLESTNQQSTTRTINPTPSATSGTTSSTAANTNAPQVHPGSQLVHPNAQPLTANLSISPPNTSNRDVFTQSATTSPGLYQAFGYPQYQNSDTNSSVTTATPTTQTTDPSSFSLNPISHQFSSLNLNNS